MVARTFPPESARNRNSAGATRATRRRPDIGFGKPLSSKEVAVERYVSRLGQSPEIAGGKPYVGIRSTGGAAAARVRPPSRSFIDGGRSRLGVPSSQLSDRRVPFAHDDKPSRDRDPVSRELIPVLPPSGNARPPDADGARVPGADDRGREHVRGTVHDARDHDGLLRRAPDARGLEGAHDAAAARRHGPE